MATDRLKPEPKLHSVKNGEVAGRIRLTTVKPLLEAQESVNAIYFTLHGSSCIIPAWGLTQGF
jgi:hypothetical protein